MRLDSSIVSGSTGIPMDCRVYSDGNGTEREEDKPMNDASDSLGVDSSRNELHFVLYDGKSRNSPQSCRTMRR